MRQRMAWYSDDNSSGGPALRIGPLQKIDVRANNLARRFDLLLDPPPRDCRDG